MIIRINILALIFSMIAFAEEAIEEKEKIIRKIEKLENYTVTILEDEATIVRKSDNKKNTISKLFWGEGPANQYLPKTIVSPDEKNLLLLMQDYSYHVVDIENFMLAEDRGIEETVIVIEGAVRRNKDYSRSPLWFSLKKMISGSIIQGEAAFTDYTNGQPQDAMIKFYADITNHIVYCTDERLKQVLLLRIDSGESEIPFRIVVDEERFKSLLNYKSKVKKDK